MGYVPNMIISDSEGDDMIMEGFHQQRHRGIKSAIFNGIYSGNFQEKKSHLGLSCGIGYTGYTPNQRLKCQKLMIDPPGIVQDKDVCWFGYCGCCI